MSCPCSHYQPLQYGPFLLRSIYRDTYTSLPLCVNETLLEHTHTQDFHVLFGHPMGVMVLYCANYKLKYTPHRKHLAILDFQKTVFLMGLKSVPTRVLDITIFVGTFCPHNIGYS